MLNENTMQEIMFDCQRIVSVIVISNQDCLHQCYTSINKNNSITI